MNFELANVRTLSDSEYFRAKDVDENFIGLLMVAYGCIENACIYADLNTVDNAAQKEYALFEIRSTIDLLRQITEKLEGN